jgi:hypothetical protein
MRRRRTNVFVVLFFASCSLAALANGCSATTGNNTFTTGSGGETGSTGGASGKGGTGTTSTHSGTGGDIVIITMDGGDASDAVEEQIIDPCSSECGPVELCDDAHLGLDDNCDGLVDEVCACQAGQAHFCFKGDPGQRGKAGCFDGSETCTEQGKWGPCVGGVHAFPPDNCFLNDMSACHAISAPPYSDVALKQGTGNFSSNALVGTETYTVTCPPGVSQCPMVTAPDVFKPLQSGEYSVTYTKYVAGDPNPKSCDFPLFVGAPGLRVELSWEHTTADNGVDLDLHLHQPNNTGPWGISPGVAQDCTWSNCVVDDFSPPQSIGSPHWFADPPAMPPTPVNWFKDLIHPENNTCYNDPRGVGAEWQALNLGCHNPRLDADNITCDYSITDPNNYSFCTPENINVDFPPVGQWFRVGVHYYNNHGLNYDVHPELKIFCNGALAGHLGPQGYYVPEAPITFEPSDGAGVGGNRFWIAADVAFTDDKCGGTSCTVRPVYSDAAQKTPFFTIDDAAVTSFAPPYPPPP